MFIHCFPIRIIYCKVFSFLTLIVKVWDDFQYFGRCFCANSPFIFPHQLVYSCSCPYYNSFFLLLLHLLLTKHLILLKQSSFSCYCLPVSMTFLERLWNQTLANNYPSGMLRHTGNDFGFPISLECISPAGCDIIVSLRFQELAC